MKNPEICEEMKPYEMELAAAANRGDIVELRRIIEKAGFAWVDRQAPETCKNEIDRQAMRKIP
jgi:hypothetical protein